MDPTPKLAAPRVVITGHRQDGASVFQSDGQGSFFSPFGHQGGAFCNIHGSPSVPVSNTASLPDISNQIPRCPSQGAWFCTSDIPPNFSVAMHRTSTIDYLTVLSGEVVLKLDGGEEKTVKAGDIVINRGCHHQWTNKTNEQCRIACVSIAAQTVVLEDGTTLEASHPQG
jgi:mannose-6-phosphate isomerase-like protein (cupin superfamily)